MNEDKNAVEFERCKLLFKNFVKATENLTKRIEALNNTPKNKEDDFYEIIQESVIQTHEIAIELAWKTAKCYALKIEPSGKVAGSTTAIKLALSTGVIKSEEVARQLIEGVQHRNLSSHEYLIVEGLDEYVTAIQNVFFKAMKNLVEDLKEL